MIIKVTAVEIAKKNYIMHSSSLEAAKNEFEAKLHNGEITLEDLESEGIAIKFEPICAKVSVKRVKK